MVRLLGQNLPILDSSEERTHHRAISRRHVETLECCEERMTSKELEHARAELHLARERREFLFWTIRTILSLLGLLAVLVALLVWIVQGLPLEPKDIIGGLGIGRFGATK